MCRVLLRVTENHGRNKGNFQWGLPRLPLSLLPKTSYFKAANFHFEIWKGEKTGKTTSVSKKTTFPFNLIYPLPPEIQHRYSKMRP